MTTYTGTQSILDESLGDYINYGFELVEASRDKIILSFKGELIAELDKDKATYAMIQHGCRLFLKNMVDKRLGR